MVRLTPEHEFYRTLFEKIYKFVFIMNILIHSNNYNFSQISDSKYWFSIGLLKLKNLCIFYYPIFTNVVYFLNYNGHRLLLTNMILPIMAHVRNITILILFQILLYILLILSHNCIKKFCVCVRARVRACMHTCLCAHA